MTSDVRAAAASDQGLLDAAEQKAMKQYRSTSQLSTVVVEQMRQWLRQTCTPAAGAYDAA